ncbi:MAG: 4-hydroxy-3-methylbut-2-enyl diphosphate reductase [Deltaproteobacteria bacterium]|nr:4-hydroxy-3-methylbut-2-enyl diphosphate reductase [Deltaproteobacteria bacterium]
MEIRLARTAGFCMGVRRAVDLVLDIAQHKGKESIYTYGPLIHNPQTIELLKKRGIMPIDHIDDIEASDNNAATIIIRAHGISPQEREKIKENGIRIIDATCPKVAHVQAIIKKHAQLNYAVLIVGDAGHPEVNSLHGYSYGKGFIIGNIDDCDKLPQLDKVCVVAQTTQSVDDYARIIQKIKDRYPQAVIFNTICDSTEKRQSEVKRLAGRMDAMFIVGGRNSANTKRLVTLSEEQGTPTYHIETADELNELDIKKYDKIGISAGASTPNWIIERIMDQLSSYSQSKNHRLGIILRSWQFCVRTDIYSAVGAGCLSFSSMLLQQLDVNIFHILTSALYVYAMHTFNRFINLKRRSIIGSFREYAFGRHEKVYVLAAVIAIFIALALAFLAGPGPFLLLLAISISGVLYNTKLLPDRWRIKSVKDLPGSKNVSMALAWACVVAVVPQLEMGFIVTAGMIVAFLFAFFVVFIRSALSDMLDIQGDSLIGRETIPVLIGKKQTQKLLWGISFFTLAMLMIAHSAGWTSSLSYALITCIFYVWICFYLCDRRAKFSGIIMEGILETIYIIAGLSSMIWVFVGT